MIVIIEVKGQGHNGHVHMMYGNKIVNTIETKPLCISLSNLADILLAMVKGWTPIDFGGQKGQGHNGNIWEYR